MAFPPTIAAFVLFAAGCRQSTGAQDIEAWVSEDIQTVVKVSWTTSEPTLGYVEFGDSTAYGHTTPLESEADTDHEATLLGMPSDTDVHFRVVLTADDGDEPSEDHTIATGDLPNDLPSFSFSGEGPEGYLAVPLIGSTFASVILDGEGEIVWHHVEDRGYRIFRSMMTADRQSVVYGALNTADAEGLGELVWVDIDGSNTTHVSVDFLRHDFVEVPGGGIAGIVPDHREYSWTSGPSAGTTESVDGDRIVEVSRDGEITEVWSVWDHFNPDEHGGAYFGVDGDNWSHANAIDYDAEEDVFYLSMRNFGSVIKIDRTTGEVLWGVSGAVNSFTFDDAALPFDVQHQFDLTEEGIVVFDNGTPVGAPSRAVEYALDFDNWTAEQIWSHTSDEELMVFALGDAYRYDDDQTLVTWSTSGQMQLVDSEGEVTWQLDSSLGYVFGYTWPMANLYTSP